MKPIIVVLSSLAIAHAAHPVLIVPGTGGNRLEAKLDKIETGEEGHQVATRWLDPHPLHPNPLLTCSAPPNIHSTQTYTVHWYCSKKADWYDLWLDVKQLVPGAIECWCENIKVRTLKHTHPFKTHKLTTNLNPAHIRLRHLHI